MKRFFALALVLAIMMTMAMTASAATYASGTVDFADLKPGDILVKGVTLTDTTGIQHVRCNDCKIATIVFSTSSVDGDALMSTWRNSSRHNGHTLSYGALPEYLQNRLAYGNVTITDHDGNVPKPQPAPAPTQPAPKPQPKTGVEDTLPLWFAVCAVSAAAYVMTSKKKLF